MYTLTRGPSKLATQRRTGPTQQPVESKVGEPRGRLQPGAWPPASPEAHLQQSERQTAAGAAATHICARGELHGCARGERPLRLRSLAGGGAAAGRGAEGGEHPWACAVRRENPEPPAETLCSH
ncbi:MAPK regulated corepressor interacting protein 2 isoform X2 [Gallus gallus]|uniref:MAPK regulated corepressor interacting protein 2 isoform X2 n=1 Tax=Gallus gallus TaxID=9031 RepID=UPI001AEB1984|nr:MAPK regulated corepressor interacting protein 2 isoform X2 [Gallus gallus]